MALAYATASANAALASYLTAAVSGQSVDGGAGYGKLVVGDSTLAMPSTGVLGTFTLQKPSFAIASKIATLLGVTLSTTASAAGTAALAVLADSANNPIITGFTVGISASNFIFGSVAFGLGEALTCTSGTLTHP